MPAELKYCEPEVEDPEELMRQYKETGSVELRNQLVMHYSYIAKAVAVKMSSTYHKYASVEEMVNHGAIALIDSLERFDPDQGVKFSTYAFTKVRGAIIDYVRKQDWLPRNIRQRAKEIDTAVSHLANELGRFPTDHEVAGHLGIPTDKYQKEAARVALSNTLSLDALMDARDAEGYHFEVSDQDPKLQPELVLEDQELQETLAKGIAALQKNEQLVLSLYYEKNLHMKEIAQVMEVSEPRISQIHSRAIQKLRDYMSVYLNSDPPQKTSKKRKKA